MNILEMFAGLIPKAFAQTPDVVGIISPVQNYYGDVNSTTNGGLGLLLTNFLRIFFVVAGILAFFNFMIAGFQYMMAGGDPKAMTAAWNKIWYSLLGLVLMVGAFAVAAVFGYLIFGDAMFMLRPQIYTAPQ